MFVWRGIFGTIHKVVIIVVAKQNEDNLYTPVHIFLIKFIKFKSTIVEINNSALIALVKSIWGLMRNSR